MNTQHALRALSGILKREWFRFLQQRARLLSAIVRPLVWLLVFATGFRSILGVSIIPPYQTYIYYPVYIMPGLIGMILLFNGMQSSLSMVYDREMGVMRVLLTAPLPRWYLLVGKLLAGTTVSIIQAYVFLLICHLVGYRIPVTGWFTVLPAMILVGLMLSALGMFLSTHVRQMENFAGVMNFVIFPMFFLSSALYPLWRVLEGSEVVYYLALGNPFTHAVELLRFAIYRQVNWIGLLVVATSFVLFLLLAIHGYDPQKGMARRAIAT
ncbi:MAG: multidrug ABC transporter permease [Nitrospinota bacterium]|nr:MAG: multidrug ABC transporter permease [Nitrospinota bacterium]